MVGFAVFGLLLRIKVSVAMLVLLLMIWLMVMVRLVGVKLLEVAIEVMNSMRARYFFLFAFLAHWALQYLFLLSNVVKTFPQIEHFF